MSYGTLTCTRIGAVDLIELISDDGMNCYSPEMGEDLVAALRKSAQAQDVAAIVLTGRGRAFCAGAHRNVLSGQVGASGLIIGQEHFIAGFAAEFAALPKLTIAAINGATAGIGVTMSLLCDLRLAVPGAKLRLNFAELGIMPGLGSTATLPALIGPAAAKRLLLCDRMILSDEAAKIGLIDEIVAPEKLVAHALALGEAAAACRPGTVAEIKACIAAPIDAARSRELASAQRLRRR